MSTVSTTTSLRFLSIKCFSLGLYIETGKNFETTRKTEAYKNYWGTPGSAVDIAAQKNLLFFLRLLFSGIRV
jgi:hypothetical protein